MFTARADETFPINPEKGTNASLRLGLGVFALFTFVSIIFCWQWLPSLSSALIGPPEDNMQDFWNTWYASVSRTPGDFFNTKLIRFPEGTPLYYHSFAYPKILAVALSVKVLGSDPTTLVLLHNLSLLISFPIAGTGAFFLIRHVTPYWPGALLGGYIFAFNPSHVEQVMHHAHVSSIEFIPLFVLAYLVTLQRRSLPLLALTIALFAINALSCWYYMFYLGYFVLFHTIYMVIRNRAFPRGWSLFVPLSSCVGVVVLLLPLLIPMITTAIASEAVYLDGSDIYVADVGAYLAPPQYHLFGPIAQPFYDGLTGNPWEATVYLGLVNVFVLGWLWHSTRGKDTRLLAYVLCGMLVFGILASGDSLHFAGLRTIPMPNAILSELPFFRNVRTPSRAIVFVYLFLAIGVGYAINLLWSEGRERAFRKLVAIALLIVVDSYPFQGLATTPVLCSPGHAIIRDDPERGFGVLDFPNGKPTGYYEGNFYMLRQQCHGRPIAQGNTSRNIVRSLRDTLESEDMAAQRQELIAARVKYIILNDFSWRPEDGDPSKYRSVYQVVYEEPKLTILKIY